MSDLGTLDAPVITAPDSITAGSALEVRWEPVANAERYWVYLREKSTGDTLGSTSVQSDTTSVTIAAGIIPQGEYEIWVNAYASGWYDSNASRDLSVQAPAAGHEFAYTVLDDGTVRLTAYLASGAESVEVPAQIDGYTVSCVGYGTFGANCPAKVTIPDGVEVGSYAFDGASALTDLYMPHNPGRLGSNFLYDCGEVTLHVYQNTSAHI